MRRHCPLLPALCLALCFVSFAHAADEPAAAPANPATPTATPGANEELEEVQISSELSQSLSSYRDKVAQETLTERANEAALNDPAARAASDVAKSVSGVSVGQGANGNSTVSVRGMDQRLLRITVDGQRQGGAGALDSIPPEIVQSLEVTKTFTPDMEADAIGGVINISTGGNVVREGYLQGRHQVTENPLAPHPGSRNSLTAARPFALHSDANNASLLATVTLDDSYAQRERYSALREWTPQTSPGPAPFTGQSVPTLTLPLIESTYEHRQRLTAVLNADARFGDTAAWLHSNFGRDRAQRDRGIVDTDPASGRALALTPGAATFSGVALSRRDVAQEAVRNTLSVTAGLRTQRGKAEIEVLGGYSHTRDREPESLDTGFLSDHRYRVSYELSDPFSPQFAFSDETVPGDATSRSDPSHYLFNYLYVTHVAADEQDGSVKTNIKLPFAGEGDYLKFGGALRQRRTGSDTDRTAWQATSTALTMGGLTDAPVSLQTLQQVFSPIPAAASVAAQLAARPAAFALNSTQSAINSTSGDWAVREDIWALYGMARRRMSPTLTLIGGVRAEGTSMHSRGNQMLLAANGSLLGFQSTNASNHYTQVLPGLHLRYEPAPGLLYRASITRSMSRPVSGDLAPFRTLSFVDHRSRTGTPDLKPYLSTNLDFSVDRFTARTGLLSLAVFYKKIDHFIGDAQTPVQIGNLGTFIDFVRINGEAAWAAGAELSWQSPDWTLPGELGHGNLVANYSYTHGEAHHPTRPGEVFPLPDQPVQQGSLRLHGVRGPVTLDAGLTYRGAVWEDLIARDFDNYMTAYWTAELSGSYAFSKTGRITASAGNLLNQPLRHYSGVLARANEWQRNGRDFMLGVQWRR